MKHFFEQYGGVAFGTLALLVLIAMITPVGNIIKTSLQETVQTFSTKMDGQVDTMTKQMLNVFEETAHYTGFVGNEFYSNGVLSSKLNGYVFNENRTLATKDGITKEVWLDVDVIVNGDYYYGGITGYEFDYYINDVLVAENVQDYHVAYSLANDDMIKIVVKKYPSDKLPKQSVIEQKLYDVDIYDGTANNGKPCFDMKLQLKFVDA